MSNHPAHSRKFLLQLAFDYVDHFVHGFNRPCAVDAAVIADEQAVLVAPHPYVVDIGDQCSLLREAGKPMLDFLLIVGAGCGCRRPRA